MTPNQIKSKERAIGKQAAKMAEAYIHQVLRQKLNIRNQGDNKNIPILDATKVKAKMGQHRLLGLNFTSSKVGFMLHYGFNGVREGGAIYLKAARYQQGQALREPHQANLKSYKLFENIYERSGALNYMINALGDTRTEDVIAKLSGLLLQLNTKDE
jgi:hypothetical protein